MILNTTNQNILKKGSFILKSKRLGAIILACMLALSTSVPAFAAGETTIGSQIEKEIPSESITSVLENNAEIDPTCPWTTDTQVQEVIPTYDLDNQINGYILNLSTDATNTGYLVYDISSGEPVLTEFGYEGVYSIQGEEVTKKSELGKSKLIPVGINEYVLQKGNDLYTIKTNTKITDQKDEIQKVVKQKETDIADYIQSKQRASTLSTRAQEIYSSVSVPNLFQFGYYPVTFKFFEGHVSGNLGCTPIAGINMLRYWTDVRGVSIFPKRMTAQDWYDAYDALASFMGTDKNGSTKVSTAFGNMGRFLNQYASNKPKGNDEKTKFLYIFGTLDFEWIKTQMNNGNPMCLAADASCQEGSTAKGGHTFFGVGYQLTSTGDFIRVANGWDTSFSHFIQWDAHKSHIERAWYYRW